MLGLLEVALKNGLVFSLLAMGYYVSFTILDFPDLTVEGTFLCGGVVFGVLVTHGCNPWLALLAALAVGCLFGMLTGFLHVRLHIRPLLCGILVATALITVNLIATSVGVTGDWRGEGSSIITYPRDLGTLHSALPFSLIPARVGGVSLRDMILFLFVAVIFKILLDLFLKTRRGLLLRATGNNAQFVTTLAKDAGNNKILGLAIGNGFAAVSGALYTHIAGGVNQSMGIGTVVIGLASLSIGLSVFHKVRFLHDTTKVIMGAIIYQGCLSGVNKLGVPTAYNKLIMAFLFVLALLFGDRVRHKRRVAKGTKGE